MSVLAHEQRVRIFDGITELANHLRSLDRHQVFEEPAHLPGAEPALRVCPLEDCRRADSDR